MRGSFFSGLLYIPVSVRVLNLRSDFGQLIQPPDTSHPVRSSRIRTISSGFSPQFSTSPHRSCNSLAARTPSLPRPYREFSKDSKPPTTTRHIVYLMIQFERLFFFQRLPPPRRASAQVLLRQNGNNILEDIAFPALRSHFNAPPPRPLLPPRSPYLPAQVACRDKGELLI